MTKVTFLLSKDPTLEHGGDLGTSRIVIRLAAEAFDVSAICLSSQAGSTVLDLLPGELDVIRVAKPRVDRARIVVRSLRSRRSLVHTRFDIDDLLPVIEECDADIFVAEHSYMAETYLRSAQRERQRLVVNTINPESSVWLANRGLLGRMEYGRLLRDELRVGRAAVAVGTYGEDEAEFYRSHGVPAARWIELTYPPADQLDIGATPRRLVFLGVRDWPPNQEAFLHALKLWPRIADGIPDAELCIAGAKKPGQADPVYPPAVRDLGLVDDLPAFLASCRALMAPVKTGGGVRAKLLEAVSRGLPVVATTPAIGSLGRLFDLPAYDDDDAFVEQCRRFLLDPASAVAAGSRLYELNRQHWAQGGPQRSIEKLLGTVKPA